MKTSFAFVAAALASGIQGCFLTAHSSTVGDFGVSHSEPKDHGGAAQTVNWSHGGCTIKGQLKDGCVVQTTSTTGCGSLSFTIAHPGRFARGIPVADTSA